MMFTEILPTLRALVAKELLEKYRMTQKQVAAILGVTQPAVSQYKKGIRGNKQLFIPKKKIVEFSKKIAYEIYFNDMKFYEKICYICENIKDEIKHKEVDKFLCLSRVKGWVRKE